MGDKMSDVRDERLNIAEKLQKIIWNGDSFPNLRHGSSRTDCYGAIMRARGAG